MCSQILPRRAMRSHLNAYRSILRGTVLRSGRRLFTPNDERAHHGNAQQAGRPPTPIGLPGCATTQGLLHIHDVRVCREPGACAVRDTELYRDLCIVTVK